MQILVVLANPDKDSFNHAIAREVLRELHAFGHAAFFHDLYAERFDPILRAEEIPSSAPIPVEIEAHCRELAVADGIIVIHPNWWGQPPAILKGWVDRVVRPKLAYRFEEGTKGEGLPVGLLKAQFAIVFNTSNTPAEREASAFGDPLQTLWKRCIFDFCGVKNFDRIVFNTMVTSSTEQREQWLQQVTRTVKRWTQPQ